VINQEHINNLISKFFAGEASPDEAMWLDDWKKESKENGQYFEECCRLAEATGHSRFINPDANAAWKKIEPQLNPHQNVIPLYKNKTLLRIAASVALLVCVGMAVKYGVYCNR
jgi:transmembrane sensor